MTNKQIWQTIALDLKRAANYSATGSKNKSDYYLAEARDLYNNQNKNKSMKKIENFVKFSGNPEDLLLGASLITGRI